MKYLQSHPHIAVSSLRYVLRILAAGMTFRSPHRRCRREQLAFDSGGLWQRAKLNRRIQSVLSSRFLAGRRRERTMLVDKETHLSLMATNELSVIMLERSADRRGRSFSVPVRYLHTLGRINDIRLSELRPGHVRGNHYYRHSSQLIVVVYDDCWSLHWDQGPGTPSRHRYFEGQGAVLVVAPPLCSRAVRNDGDRDILITIMSDVVYAPDSVSQENKPISRVVTNDLAR